MHNMRLMARARSPPLQPLRTMWLTPSLITPSANIIPELLVTMSAVSYSLISTLHLP